MAQGLAHKTPINRGATLFAGGGGGATHYHPFKFVDASTTGPVVVKTKIGVLSDVMDSLYPMSTMPITGIGGSGGYGDPIPITEACSIYLKGTVSSLECTAIEVTKTDPSDGEMIEFDAATPPVQTAFYVLLAVVAAGSSSTEPGYNFMIGENPFHLTQVAFNHLRLEQRVTSGRVVLLAVPV